MRESLYEQLKKKELSFINELVKITNLIDASYVNTPFYFKAAFKKSCFCVFFEDFDTAMYKLFENDYEYDTYGDNLDELIGNTLRLKSNLTLNCFLNYLEFFATLFLHNDRNYDTNAKQIHLIILNDCERLGYKFIKDGYTVKTMLKNPEAEAVAIKAKETIRGKIYKYLMLRPGAIEEKRNCIKSLADDVEVICKRYSNINEYDKLKQFIQCTRHTKDEPKKEFPFYYENEEEWLDKTFDMIIGVLSFTKTKEIVKEINKLENM